MSKNAIIAIMSVVIVFLVAVCIILFIDREKCTVTFNSDGGTLVASQRVKENSKVSEPEKPTKEGFIFVGWYYSDSKDKEFDFSTLIDKDIELIAKWEKEINDISRISIVAEKNELNVNEELELSLRIVPGNASTEGLEIIWTSSDEKVATVDQNGKVTALKKGVANITVEIDGIKSTIGIKVTGNEQTSSNTNKSTAKKSTNTNKNTNTNSKESTETVTYSYKWEDVGSVVGQMKLYIVSSKGDKVAGTVTLTSTDGDTVTETIPATGKILNKNDIASVTNIKTK